MANNGKIIDIIHKKFKWYNVGSCNDFPQIALKSTIKNGLRNLDLIFDDIIQITKKLN